MEKPRFESAGGKTERIKSILRKGILASIATVGSLTAIGCDSKEAPTPAQTPAVTRQDTPKGVEPLPKEFSNEKWLQALPGEHITYKGKDTMHISHIDKDKGGWHEVPIGVDGKGQVRAAGTYKLGPNGKWYRVGS